MECMSCCLENVHVSIFVPSIHLSLLLTQWAELYGYGVLGLELAVWHVHLQRSMQMLPIAMAAAMHERAQMGFRRTWC